MVNLQGKSALITGSAKGIGRACAQRLSEAGAEVILHYHSSEGPVQELASTLHQAYGYEPLCLQADLNQVDEVEALFAQLKARYSQLDILINNAGTHSDHLFLRMSQDQWDSVIDTNLKGLFACTKLAANMMFKQKSGRIINITSVVGQLGNVGQTNYAASKAGIMGFTRSLALELARRNITVNAVAPGYIASDMTASLPPNQKELLLKKIPMQRFGECHEVAEMVLFLSSPQSQYITGQIFNIDGGLLIT